MGDGVDEAVVLLVQFNFTNQETSVEDQSKNNCEKEEHAEEEQHSLTPVEDDPSNVQCDSQRNEANPQSEKEGNGPPAAGNSHVC